MAVPGEPNAPQRAERRLAAILAADVAGYSRLMEAGEEETLAALRAIRGELVDAKIAEHRGRIVKTTGDGLLVEFHSVLDAVRCAVEVQQGMASRNADIAAERRIEFRIGINLGDIIIEDDDIFGDGVNVAARLEAMAEPGGVCVSGVVREQVGERLDVNFEDLGERQVKNISRPVHVFRVRPGASASAASPPLALPDKPSLVVLPFQNMSGDPEQEYFGDGMVEEITTAIARLPWLFVIARNSAFTYKGKAVDVKQVARDLGVRYVLEGSVRKAANRVRITGQLIDTASGAHIWADRFDGTLDDVFELQDQVASSVAGAIEPKLRQSEIDRANRKPTGNLGAYDLYLRALAELYKTTLESFAAALPLARQALAIDPGNVLAASLVAAVRGQQHVNGVRLSGAEIEEAVKLARFVIQSGSNDPESLSRSGGALAWLAGDHAAALSAIERATTLNPNCAHAWYAAANVNCFANHPEAAISAVQRAMRLSPLDPIGFMFKGVRAYALMLTGRYEEGMEWLDRAMHDRPNHHALVRFKVALSGYLGRTDDARLWVARLRELNPSMSVTGFQSFARHLSSGTMAVWVEGFRRAGLPEE